MYICWKMSGCDSELSHLDNGGITLEVSALVNNHSLISNSVLLYIYGMLKPAHLRLCLHDQYHNKHVM